MVERNASQHPVAMMQQNNQAPVFKSLPEAAYTGNVHMSEYYSQMLIFEKFKFLTNMFSKKDITMMMY